MGHRSVSLVTGLVVSNFIFVVVLRLSDNGWCVFPGGLVIMCVRFGATILSGPWVSLLQLHPGQLLRSIDK